MSNRKPAETLFDTTPVDSGKTFNGDEMADQKTAERTFRKSSSVILICGCLTIASVFAAAYFAGQARALHALQLETAAADLTNADGLLSSDDFARIAADLPSLDATAAVSSEKFSMATGLVSNRAEGLFVLDHNSGLLQCSVMYPQIGKFLGLFTVNVHDALGTGKGAQYMMATGLVDMQSSSNNPIASSVVYVLNNTNGAYACYYIPFNESLMNRRQPQSGNMRLLGVGSADPVVDRDALR